MLLHLWSLSIEEQFYIFFPIIFFLVYKYYNKRIYTLIFIFFVSSLLFATLIHKGHSSFNYYLLPSRIFELITGSFLAIVKFKKLLKNKSICNFLTTLGFGIIILSFFYFDKNTAHPSIKTLIPIFGIFLVMLFYNKNSLIKNLLTNKILVYIGLISYPLYLWHWPILAISKILHNNLNEFSKFVILIIVFLFSIFTYHVIEKPIRTNVKINLRTLNIKIGLSIIFIIIFCAIGIANNGFNKNFPEFIVKLDKNFFYESNSIKNFKIYNNNSKKNIILIGDSHAYSLGPYVKKMSKKLDYNYAQIIKNGCPPIVNLNRVNKKNFKVFNDCDIDYQNKRLDFIKKIPGEKIVIIMGHYSILINEHIFQLNKNNKHRDIKDFFQNTNNNLNNKAIRNEAIKTEFLNLLKNLSVENIQTILVYPVPEMTDHIIKNILKNLRQKDFFLRKPINSIETISLHQDEYKIRNQLVFDIFNQKNDLTKRVYPHKLFCDQQIKNHCVANLNKEIFYRDSVHLSAAGAKLLVNEIEKVVPALK